MLTNIAIIFSIFVQLIATIFAIRLIKLTKYNVSWILISIGLLIMAIRRFFELLPFIDKTLSEPMLILNSWLGIIISLLMAVGIFFIGKIFTYLKKMEEARLQSEKRVLNVIILTEENERKRLAKDLHDGLGPLLSSVKMSVSALSTEKNLNTQNSILTNAIQAVNESINSLKEISNNLSPHILDNFGLVSAIRSFATKIEQTGKIKIEFRTNLREQRFNNNIEVILYRAICELINNTTKHAKARKILISLDLENDQLNVLYQDDGKGFNFEETMLQHKGGMGLHNIRSRTSSINGDFNIESQPGEGIIGTIRVKI
jgi:signal transduction histidine kinase